MSAHMLALGVRSENPRKLLIPLSQTALHQRKLLCVIPLARLKLLVEPVRLLNHLCSILSSDLVDSTHVGFQLHEQS